jgi:molecular chaperone DnaK (HSP70)
VSWNNSTILPSAVWLAEDNNVFTGALCVEYADIISEHAGSKVVHGIKSELANRHWVLKHNGQDYRPAEISSILLRTVWVAICSKNFPEINGIIITIPSSFSSTMRRETLRAARMAGLPMDKVSLLDEPIAALFSEYRDTKDPFTKIQTEEPILVFDMGGGTVDVTVLKILPTNRVVDVLSTSRYNQVAGDDLDLEIAAYLWRRLNRDFTGRVPELTRSLALALLRAGEEVKRKVNERVQSFEKGNAKDLSTECRNNNDTLVASFGRPFNSTERLELSIPIADVLDLVLPFISKDELERNFTRNIFTPIQQARDSADCD